jgi:hypothetical protein
MTDWQYARNYGCNTAIGCPNLLTFRSAAAGYFDLLGDGGTGNFGGFRAGCTSNLIPAGGILVAPDYTRTCTCAYQNQTSLAMVHAREAEMWTFQSIAESARPLQRLGINFGAPGDRRGPDGTLWLEYPAVGGPSPDPRIECDIQLPEYPRHHESRIASGDLRWVAASGIRGAGEISIRLASEPRTPAGEPTPQETRELQYTVRLVFAEVEGLAPGERVFDVEIQGEPQLRDFDICREAGGPWRTVIREFQDVSARGKLRLGLVGRGKNPPLLCGVQVIVSSSRF